MSSPSHLGLNAVCVVLCDLFLTSSRHKDVTLLIEEVVLIGLGIGEAYNCAILLQVVTNNEN